MIWLCLFLAAYLAYHEGYRQTALFLQSHDAKFSGKIYLRSERPFIFWALVIWHVTVGILALVAAYLVFRGVDAGGSPSMSIGFVLITCIGLLHEMILKLVIPALLTGELQARGCVYSRTANAGMYWGGITVWITMTALLLAALALITLA